MGHAVRLQGDLKIDQGTRLVDEGFVFGAWSSGEISLPDVISSQGPKKIHLPYTFGHHAYKCRTHTTRKAMWTWSCDSLFGTHGRARATRVSN